MTTPARSPLPPAVLPVAVAILLLFGFGPNLPLALLAVTILLVGSALLWRPGESPILLLLFGYQWLQASARIFHANFKGVDVADLSYAGGQVSLASTLSLLALLSLAAGLRAGVGRWRGIDGQLCREIVLSRNTRSWFRLYLLGAAGAAAALFLARFVPPLSQPLLALATMKWAFFWVLAYATFVRPDADRRYLLVAFLFEFSLGLGSYFSDFKTVFFITILAMAAAGMKISGRRLVSLTAVALILVSVTVVWTAVKVEYRYFLSAGERAQVVTANYGESITTLAQMVARLDSRDLADAVEESINRISYVDFFAVVLDRVPAVVPHEHGALWLDAISRPFMPRILFPEKSAIHDSERTNYYTRLSVSSYDVGTSISIGYIAETYIDFGTIGMMVVIFIYGLILGRVYRWFVRGPRTRGLLGMALISAILLGAMALESSITKVIGGLIVSILVAYLIARWVVPLCLPWLRAGKGKYRLTAAA
ncbi:O-antigen polysaccharide polymerase Wzy [Silicimonas algicola]|uniref:O-antigen polysaccharide polymerase Wzy-like protein n=1 Tax=Silicimonas algicola TaxID=1826607 RepID=A0A316FX28_9RHOB|nr:O-antigen polysaccharide polymerase Wzy [Silicimonas algicola]PWK53138.1 O-antigen polysaccharide polymerase Wzy-like protein [Silicimonas algicola]